jgi:hypothetical protein
LTRDPASERCKELTSKGVECVKGSFEDFVSVRAALEGCYGVWVNTDGMTCGEAKEIYAGMRIWEVSNTVPGLRHYVWSALEYSLKKGGYSDEYRVQHFDPKGRVAEWMQVQKSDASDTGLSWTVVTSCPYLEMVNMAMFGPINKRDDGTYVFYAPIEDGHVPMIALEDLGWWARYTFDHREDSSAQTWEVASDWISWPYLVETFTKVTGKPAVFVRAPSTDVWWSYYTNTDKPIASDRIKTPGDGKDGDGNISFKVNHSRFWNQWRDSVITRDFEWIRKIHPKTHTLESWMRSINYDGDVFKYRMGYLKNVADGYSFGANLEKMKTL